MKPCFALQKDGVSCGSARSCIDSGFSFNTNITTPEDNFQLGLWQS